MEQEPPSETRFQATVPEQPGKRTPAPGSLRPLQDFANTFDIDDNADLLSSADDLRNWLVTKGLLDPSEPVGADEHRTVLTVREAVRELLLANAGEPADPEAVPVINTAAGDAWLALTIASPGQVVMTPEAPGVAGAIGRILAVVFLSMLDGTWSRLKACRNPDCQWAFFDWSKNKSGVWCAMTVCGNREKARRFRRRRRAPREEVP